MKKTYLLVLSFFIGILSINAQSTCLDTIYYPDSKMTGFGPYQLISEAGNFLSGFSQTYNANTGVIHGINAFVLLDTNGIVGDASSKDIYIKVFNVDALNRPVGAAIDSNLVTLTDMGTVKQTFLFQSPVAVTGKYAISITLDPVTSIANSDSIWFRGNDESATPANGLGEGLLGLNLNLPGFGWTNFFLQFGSADYDALIAPIFEKTITASFTTSIDTICLDSNVVFDNLSTIDTNYMYNRYDSLNTEIYSWNYGDGTGIYNHFDTTYTFTAAGIYNTELIITSYGYTGNCVDTMKKTIEVQEALITASVDTAVCPGGMVNLSATGASSYVWDNGLGAGQNQSGTPSVDTMYIVTGVLAGGCSAKDTVNVSVLDTAIAGFTFSHMGGGSYQFTNTSTNANTYSWDFGDGSPLDVAPNPLHTYSLINNYTVCLTVTDSNGCNVDSVCQIVSFVTGVDDFDAANYVNVYPVPASEYFNVSVPNNYYNGNIIVTDVVGHVLNIIDIESQDKLKLSTEGMNSGIYFVSINMDGERVFTERIVVNK